MELAAKILTQPPTGRGIAVWEVLIHIKFAHFDGYYVYLKQQMPFEDLIAWYR